MWVVTTNRKLKNFGSFKSLKFCELVNLMVIADKKKVECVADVYKLSYTQVNSLAMQQ